MPRYFFNVEDHVREVDDVGEELAGPGEARIQAIIFAGAMLRDDPEMIWDGREFRVQVVDEAGDEVMSVFVHAKDADTGK